MSEIENKAWLETIDRIVPPLEPVHENFVAEWALWQDRKRIREELAALVERPTVFASRYDEDLGECVPVEVDPPMLAKLRERVAVERKAEPVAVPEDATPAMIAAALAVDWSNESEEATAHNVWHAFRSSLSASPSPVDSRDALIERLVTPHSYAQEYEFRGDGGDYVPTDGERTMIEDAICGYLGELAEARLALAAKEQQP